MFNNIAIFIIGTIFGSFINVCIYRLPRNLSIISPGSYCPCCNKKLSIIELIPILSYLILGGRCRGCGTKISIRYLFVEILSGLLLFATFQRFSLSYEFFIFGLLNLILLLIIFIDLDFFLILDIVTLPVMIAGVLFSVCPHYPFPQDILKSVLFSISGLFAGGGLLYFIAILGYFLFKKEALGFGDVKMMAMIGAFLGPEFSIYILFIAALIGSFYGITGILLRKFTRKDFIPFGPFISLATYIMIFYGNLIRYS
ncbi:MAG: prepilin peptidase [Candidatus Hydrogenedentota bacterium]